MMGDIKRWLEGYAQPVLSWWSGSEYGGRPDVVMIGLQGAGKTTLLHRCRFGEDIGESVMPTTSFNVETVLCSGGMEMRIWDMSGTPAVRSLWHLYSQQVQAMIVVIDITDRDKMSSSAEKNDLLTAMSDIVEKNVVFLVFLNKIDMAAATALSESDIVIALELGSLQMKGRQVLIQSCSARTGEGVMEGMHRLEQALSK